MSTATETTFANIVYEKKGAIAYVTVNRPKVLNALNTPTWTDLQAAFKDAKSDASVHGVILTGAGDKAVIAGADISEFEGAERHFTSVLAWADFRFCARDDHDFFLHLPFSHRSHYLFVQKVGKEGNSPLTFL